ncbi:uncharacterized protein LOC143259349 [Megalopta genalis]|uniref:uncharacterized protein LOC143259349 n=1 Tax=Megalopta genalis TaxID=115081 RepID=UPI003FD217AB
MDPMLQRHGAKHVYKVPEGLRELSADISREVLRSQPSSLYDFIAEYVDTLLITRENTKVAVKVVNNILLGSEAILAILYRAGFTLEQIALAAPRIQKAFREYLDAVDTQPEQVCTDYTEDEKSKISVRSILEATGSSRENAERAATVIQAAFRGHYERMLLDERQGKVQWRKAVGETLEILRKAGATQSEILKAAKHLKFAYRGYYIRRNQKIDVPETEEELKEDSRIVETAQTIQAVAWMEMMYNDSGLTMKQANEAATVIQRAYKQYRERRGCYDVQRLESTKSMIVQAVIDSLHQRVFQKVMSRDDIPMEYGTKEELTITSTKVQMAIKERLRMSRLSMDGERSNTILTLSFELRRITAQEEEGEEAAAEEGEEIEDDKEGIPEKEEETDLETEETASALASPDSEYRPAESEAKTDAEYTEEQLTEAEMDARQTSEVEMTTEQLPAIVEPQSEAETEYPTELDTEEEDMGAEEKEKEKESAEAEEQKHEEAEEEPNVAQETGTADDAVE